MGCDVCGSENCGPWTHGGRSPHECECDDELRARIQALEAERDALRAEVLSLEDIAMRATDHDDTENARLRRECMELKESREKAHDICAELSSENARLRVENEQLHQSLSDAREALLGVAALARGGRDGVLALLAGGKP